MIELFECGRVNKADTLNLPTEKVVRSEMFGGLSFVPACYYEFILRIEYVFIKVGGVRKYFGAKGVSEFVREHILKNVY